MNQAIVLTNARLNDAQVDVRIEWNRIAKITPHTGGPLTMEDGCEQIDATGMALLPPFYNTHTHAAMTLLRGFADDMPLYEWLHNHIWPMEARLTEDDIRAGVKLAILEMIKSGTVYFNDMYWNMHLMPTIVEEMGIRATLGVTFIEGMSPDVRKRADRFVEEWSTHERIQIAIAPHAIYTVHSEMLQECASIARRKEIPLHIHVSETYRELEECVSQHGQSPVAYLDQLGILGPDVIAAHAVHLLEDDFRILADRGVVIAHCPCSNMKLSSGVFPMQAALDAGCRVTLGTDGCSSNNNLDMREEMKFAALLAKMNDSPQSLPAEKALQIATREGAMAAGIDAGVIEEGKLADLLLIRLDEPAMTPRHNVISNWVYSANSSIIDTVICNGRILMRNRRVEYEEEILEEVRRSPILNGCFTVN